VRQAVAEAEYEQLKYMKTWSVPIWLRPARRQAGIASIPPDGPSRVQRQVSWTSCHMARSPSDLKPALDKLTVLFDPEE
jgi:hypothetical protein